MQSTRLGVIAAALIAGAAFASPAHAGPILMDTWYEFAFSAPGTSATGCFPDDPAGPVCTPSSGTPTTFLDESAWTFSVGPTGAVLTVTDAFNSTDSFEVLDFGIPIGFTSFPGAFVNCGSDPVPCLADPDVSHGFFAMAPGNHSITIALLGGVPGAGYLIVEPSQAVPEPATLVLFGTGTALTLWRARKRRRD